MNQLKRFQDILSPVSWLFMSCFLAMYIVVFRPTPFEMGLLLAVDLASFWLMLSLDRRLFPKIYPDCGSYFPNPQWNTIGAMDTSGRIGVFQSLCLFPRRRAVYCFWTSFIKVAPAFAVIAFVWDHPDPPALRVLKSMAISLVVFAYFYGAVYLESHRLTSRIVEDLHRRFDFTEVFEKAEIPTPLNETRWQLHLSTISIVLFMVSLQSILLLTEQHRSGVWLAVVIGSISWMGTLLGARLIYLFRSLLTNGMHQLFQKFQDPGSLANAPVVALHTTPALAGFEKIFNALAQRIRQHQEELTNWSLERTEQGRFQALGEISALVVHDLSAPLHVVLFCSERLRENPALAQDPRYLEHLHLTAKRSMDLVSSLKGYLKGSHEGDHRVSFKDGVRDALSLLEAQYHHRGFSRIRFDVDPCLEEAVLKMSRADLVHVLLNLFMNSTENLLSNEIPEPRIVLRKTESTGINKLSLEIRDNGTGLSCELFERLTNHMPPASGPAQPLSMGLRLTRRLVESYEGGLRVSPSAHTQGTLFQLELPVFS